jgi:hypothetical protein
VEPESRPPIAKPPATAMLFWIAQIAKNSTKPTTAIVRY